jgi:hypothetical protein
MQNYSYLRYPTMHEYDRALEIADNQSDKDRDTSILIQYLTYLANHNARIKGHINTRIAAIASWQWEIVDVNNERTPQAIEAENQLRGVIQRVPRLVVNSSLYGNSAANLIWKRENDKSPWLANINIVRQKFIESLDDNTIIIKRLGKNITIADGDQNYLKASDGCELRGGVLRSVGEMEIFRHDMIKEWANYNRKLKGLIQGIDKGADDGEHKAAEDALKLSMQNAYLLSSDMIDFQFHQLAATQGSSFKDLVEQLNSSIAIAIMGQANTSELPSSGGSRAALQVQQMISADIMFADIQLYERIINEQLLQFDYAKNYGLGSPPWHFHVVIDEITDYEQNVIVIREALNSGIPLIKSEVYEKIGFKAPQPNDEIFNPLATSAPLNIQNFNQGG